jgi:protein-S-isoprenylcysteine O-methyltransferase Ste14
MFTRKLIFGVVWNVAIYGGVLFLVAGKLDWWRAWIFLGVLAITTIATMWFVFRTRPGLLKERLKGTIQRGQPIVDRVLVILFMLSHGLTIAFIPLDVFELHIFPKPNVFVSSCGLLLIIVGWWIIALVFKENDFAAPVVRHQAERQHHVVDTGVYAIVRHPMYAGIFIFNVGTALWLESYAAALAALVPMCWLAIRIIFEERFLKRELSGYTAYTQKVHYRMIPFVW